MALINFCSAFADARARGGGDHTIGSFNGAVFPRFTRPPGLILPGVVSKSPSSSFALDAVIIDRDVESKPVLVDMRESVTDSFRASRRGVGIITAD